jgi:hypothetical protein
MLRSWSSLANDAHALVLSLSRVSLCVSWSNYGVPASDGAATLHFYLDALDHVHLTGLLIAGTLNVPVVTLPVGYRPAFTRYFAFNGRPCNNATSKRKELAKWLRLQRLTTEQKALTR